MASDKEKIGSVENFFLLSLLHGDLTRSIRSPHNIAPAQVRAMLVIRRQPGIIMSELAHKLNISKPNLTPAVNQLVELGLVYRAIDDADRRIVHLNLTDQGQNALSDISGQLADYLTQRISRLRLKERGDFFKCINKLTELIEKLVD
jgi:DNA-binding MarR family transcriptional regulator